MSKIELEYTPRIQQTQILNFVKDSITNNNKFIMIDAPTGVGKSYAAIMISDWYRKNVTTDAKIDIITNTKILQDQYTRDFNFISTLKGKNNYWCNKQNMSCGDADFLNKAINKNCRNCAHKIAKSKFARSNISLTNFHLITTYQMYSEEFFEKRNAKLLIIDEAHGFEETFCGFISSIFSKKSLSAFDVWYEYMEDDLNKIKNIKELSEYTKKVIVPLLESKIIDLVDQAKNTRGRKKKLDIIKKANHADKSMCKYNRFIEDSDNFDTNWIFEKDLDQYGNIRILVEPVWGSIYLEKYFWKNYDHVIFMSGTILNKDLFSKIMGVDTTITSYLSIPCPFEVTKRPVIYVKFGKMSYYNKAKTFKRAVPILNRILDKNKEVKGIIHTSNYELSTWLERDITNTRLIFHTYKTREKSLQKHISSEFETVLVSPSMINGIDLKDDLSRFQIILKIPFPNLKSNKVKKRLATNPDWYSWKTLVDLLQAYGRSIRNDGDWAETYILDECFDQVLNNNVPEYFKEALTIKILK